MGGSVDRSPQLFLANRQRPYVLLLKATNRSLAAVTISLHGPDERHGRPGFKFDRDKSSLAKVAAAGIDPLKNAANQFLKGVSFSRLADGELQPPTELSLSIDDTKVRDLARSAVASETTSSG